MLPSLKAPDKTRLQLRLCGWTFCVIVTYIAEPFTETKELQRISGHIPREIHVHLWGYERE